MKIKTAIVKVLNFLTVVIFSALIVVVAIQVLGRTPLFSQPFHWTEELTRMLFIGLIAVGSITGVLHDEYVAVDIFSSMFKGKALIIYNSVIHFLLGAFLIYLIPASLKFMKLGARQSSPGLRINMQYIYGLILISIVGMGIAQIYKGVESVISLKNRQIGEEGINE